MNFECHQEYKTEIFLRFGCSVKFLDITKIPIYSSRLENLIERCFIALVFSPIVFGGFKLIQYNQRKESNINSNKSLIYKVERLTWGDDYTSTDEEGRRLIEELKIPYPKGEKEHLLRFYVAEDGAYWNASSTPWNTTFLGKIPREELEKYIKRHSNTYNLSE